MSDVDIGSTLTIDHHRPRSRGGRDDDENLVYACPRCNEHKGPYWHEDHPPHVPLLHPERDELARHLREDNDGCLVGLTTEGTFFIEKLDAQRQPGPSSAAIRASSGGYAGEAEEDTPGGPTT